METIEARRIALLGENALELLVDRECPLCRREADLLARFDRRRRLKLVDISQPGAAEARGLSQAEVMGHIHAVLHDGRVVTGVDAFVHAYAALGWTGLARALGLPGVRPVAERAYALFAKHRLWLTGRGRAAASCEGGACAVGADREPARTPGATLSCGPAPAASPAPDRR